MLVTDKIYFTSTLIAGAGCGADTFRAWRNRNGLFRETSGGGKWNKFSIIDILVTSLVSGLTHAGVTAQRAVDAATKAAPLFEKLFDVPLTKEDVLEPANMLSKIEQKLWPERTHYPILVLRNVGEQSKGKLAVELLGSQTTAENILRGEVSTIVNLRYLCRATFGSMAMADAELEIDGEKRTRPGHAKLRSRAERQANRGER